MNPLVSSKRRIQMTETDDREHLNQPESKSQANIGLTAIILHALIVSAHHADSKISTSENPIGLTPSTIETHTLNKRITHENICVVLCKDDGHRNCMSASSCAMAGICVAMNAEYSGKVPSVVIDYGHECTFWASHVCNGSRTGHVQFDQSSSFPGFDNKANSYAYWKQFEDTTSVGR
ncbi:hypothetical protein E6O75_ATG02909 [Venturia nashicola]|uniref:Uncharacterized protein n=1 Tax=Venturia nashicola TaxID=86259 RepID=A0A4Z1PQ36_9PEZI|nr:hypothetical protein E6O75_ATG02909 [Venturia nashicola]